MFVHRRLTPTKGPVWRSSGSSTPPSSKRPQLDTDDDYHSDPWEDQGLNENKISDYPITLSRKPPPAIIKVVYIVSQSNVELELEAPSPPTLSFFSECNDKVISVHTSKASANAAAKKHFRKICKVKSRKIAEAKNEEGKWEYHEGVGAKGLFVGSMKERKGYVRVESQWWKTER